MSAPTDSSPDLSAELQASRTRIVEAGDEARRKLERDLHDGAQQRFVSASLLLRLAQRKADPALRPSSNAWARSCRPGWPSCASSRTASIPRCSPTVGCGPAVDTLAARASFPVTVAGDLAERPAPAVELALYFTIAEALTNVAKYAGPCEAVVTIGCVGEQAEIEVRDDGCGGADPAGGSGLRGLVDRLGALRGHLHVESPAGGGTTVRAIVPLDPHDPRSSLACECCDQGQCCCAP